MRYLYFGGPCARLFRYGGEVMEIRCALCGKKMEINKMDKNFEAVRKGENPVIVCNMCQHATRYEAKKQVEKI